MDTRQLGTTSHQVTRLGLGLAAMGRPGYINLGHAADLPESNEVEAMQTHAHCVLDAAWELGIRYFDAARSYGRAEEFLSRWLTSRGIDKTSLTVGSKWGYTYTAGWQRQLPIGEKHEVKDHSLPVLDRQIAESRAGLGGYLNLYHIHSATLESGVFENDRVLDRLAELRDSGLTVGFSVSGPNQADAIRKGMAIERGGRPLFESVQATWNVLEQSATAALIEANQAGRAVIVKEGLANGRLTARNVEPDFRTRHADLHRLADAYAVSVDAIALACVLRQPWVDVALSGAATIPHLKSNARAVSLAGQVKLDECLVRPEPAAEYWSIRSQLAWN